MGDIYSNAALTLVAATASNSEEGFLRGTFGDARSPFQRLAYRCQDGQTGSMYLIERPDRGEPFPIESRGWTLQERLLSTRMLFFSSGRMDWVCKACRYFAGASCSYSVNLIADSLDKRNWGFSQWFPDKEEKPFVRWFNLCFTYTRRKLTDPTDRLPAFSSIAKAFRRFLPEVGDYVAGLWSISLPQQLLWMPYDTEWPLFKNCRAPSWSWASVDEKTSLRTFAYSQAKIRLEIVDYTIDHVIGSDAFGAVNGGSLRVKGRLKQAIWDTTNQTIENLPGLSVLGNTFTAADRHTHAPTGSNKDMMIPVWCLEIQDAQYWVCTFHTTRGPCYTGLLLLPHTEGQHTFHRVGLFGLARVGDTERSEDVITAARRNLCWFEDVQPQIITLV